MRTAKELMLKILDSPNEFVKSLREILRRNRLTLKEFSEMSGVPETTLYKISSGKQLNFEVNTLRNLVKHAAKLEDTEEKFIAVVAPKRTLQQIEEKSYFTGGQEVFVKGYPSRSIEEIIVNAFVAEKDGALAIVCGPLVGESLEGNMSIPIFALLDTNILSTIDLAVKKIS